MKTLLRMGLCAALLSSVAFARNPHEHRGFYFSAGIGPAYHSFSASSSSSRYRYRWNEYTAEYDYFWESEKEENSYNAFVFPAIDFRFGKSIGNLIALYSTFDFMFDTDNWECLREEQSDVYGKTSEKADSENSIMFSGGAGLGFEVYPFLNPNSVMRGFHIGESTSVNGMLLDAVGDRSEWGGVFVANRINVGMDWWVSDTWSLGVEFSYTYFGVIEVDSDDDPDRHLFRLMFRLTRG